MQKSALYCLIATVLLACAFTANRASGRLPNVKLKRVNILVLPKQIGGWTCVKEAPEEDLEYRAVPGALFHRWNFQDANRQQVELLLETASEADGYHNPMVCMTSQNWEIVAKAPTQVQPAVVSGLASRPAIIMQMQLKDRDLKDVLLYWYTRDLQLDKWHQFLAHDMSGIAPSCLFVRVSVDASGGYERAIAVARRFATEVFPTIHDLERTTQNQN
jgi:hypothetical protein